MGGKKSKSSGKKIPSLIGRDSTRGEANWSMPRHLTDHDLKEICKEIGIPASSRPAFCIALKALEKDLSHLIADMKQRGANSHHRDIWLKQLKYINAIIGELESVAQYEQGRRGRVHLDSPVIPILSLATSNFLPLLFDPRLLLPIEGSTPLHINQMERAAHMSWLHQFGAIHHATALLPVFRILRDLIAEVAEDMVRLTKSGRRPQNLLGPALLRAFSDLCIEYLPHDTLDVSPSGQIFQLASAFCQYTGLPPWWIQSQFKKTVPDYVRARLEKNMP